MDQTKQKKFLHPASHTTPKTKERDTILLLIKGALAMSVIFYALALFDFIDGAFTDMRLKDVVMASTLILVLAAWFTLYTYKGHVSQNQTEE